MTTEVEKTRIPTGTYMLMWDVNPDRRPNPSDGKIENSISTQFFSTLKDAEEMAELLSGSRIILTGWQNTGGEYNVYWYVVKKYGETFDMDAVSIMTEETRKNLIESENA